MLRFEGASLEEAVRAARGKLGPTARIVGASRVRRGGVAGFFAHEHVEVEVEVEEKAVAGGGDEGASEGEAPRGAAGAGRRPPEKSEVRRGGSGDRAARRPNGTKGRSRWPSPATNDASQYGDSAGDGAGDPMSQLIEEMAQNGPSSVLDLAEEVNAEQTRFAIAGDRLAPPRPGPPLQAPVRQVPVRQESARQERARQEQSLPAPEASAPAGQERTTVQAGFAAVLERIARQEGLVSPDHADEILPESWEPSPGPAPVHHAGALLAELGEIAKAAPRTPSEPALPTLPAVPPPATKPVLGLAPAPGRQVQDLALALQDLGLPAAACQSVAPVPVGEALEAELCRALRRVLPEVPPTPRSASSVIAVVGPPGRVMETAWGLAAEVGAPEEEIALATQRHFWRHHDRVIASPEAAGEERRSWRWRGRPSVVAVEAAIRPDGLPWARAMLQALEPTVCWGVAEASHKPEDVAAWSGALGGLDVLALVDLDGTTTPAAALTTALPVGRLDGQPATPEVWARILCSRLAVG